MEFVSASTWDNRPQDMQEEPPHKEELHFCVFLSMPNQL